MSETANKLTGLRRNKGVDKENLSMIMECVAGGDVRE